MQLGSLAPVTASLSPRTAPPLPAVEQARRLPWLMDMKLGGERVEDIMEAQPRFRIVGDGALSQRRIIGETAAAKGALQSADGPRIEQALRGLLATFDAQSGVTNLQSIGFASDPKGAAVNQLLGEMSWPGATSELKVGPNSTGAEKRAVRQYLHASAKQMPGDSDWGVSYRSISLSPQTSKVFFDGVSAKASSDDESIDTSTHVLVHELAHRMSEPPLGSMPPFEPKHWAKWSLMQLLSEGSADLITGMPGVKDEARARMGIRPVSEREFPSGYEGFVGALASVLRQAGLDARSPEHRQEIIELLERGDMRDVPASIASIIVQKQKIDWKHHHEISKAIEHIGTHGIFAEDEASYLRQQQELASRTDAAEDLIGRYAREAAARRERA